MYDYSRKLGSNDKAVNALKELEDLLENAEKLLDVPAVKSALARKSFISLGVNLAQAKNLVKDYLSRN